MLYSFLDAYSLPRSDQGTHCKKTIATRIDFKNKYVEMLSISFLLHIIIKFRKPAHNPILLPLPLLNAER